MPSFDTINALVNSGDFAGAERLCREVLESDPDNAKAKFLLEACLGRMGLESGRNARLAAESRVFTKAAPFRGAADGVEDETVQTVELPPPAAPEGPSGKRGASKPTAGKGCLRTLLAVLGGLAALVVVIVGVALFSSWRDRKNVRPLFLYQFSGVSSHWTPRAVPEGNFKVSMPYGWSLEPTFATNTVVGDGQSTGILRASRYRFDYQPNDLNWLGVEYVLFAEDRKAPENIFEWVEANVAFAGIPDLIPPEGRVLLPVNCLKALGSSPDMRPERQFLKTHCNADRMCAYVATVRQGDEYLRAFIVCLLRGREAWRIVKVGPAHPESMETERDIAIPSWEDAVFAGDVLGSFAILDPGRHSHRKRKGETLAKWPEPQPERVFKFLWPESGSSGGESEKKVEDANFSVQLDETWDKAEIRECSDCHVPCGNEKHVVSRFPGPEGTQWFSVEYVRTVPWRPVPEPLSVVVSPAEVLEEEFKAMETPIFPASHFVNMVLSLGWRTDFLPPQGISTNIMASGFMKLPSRDVPFMRKHRVDDMCSFVGCVTINDQRHAVFVVCLQRGREMWKMVNVLPSSIGAGSTGGDETVPTRADIETAARTFGSFRILSDERKECDWMARPSRPDGPETLVAAVFSNSPDAVERALAAGCDPNAPAWRNVTPLCAAVSGRRAPFPNILRILLDSGAEVEKPCGDLGDVPLNLLVKKACSGKWPPKENDRVAECVRLLIERGADPNRGDGWRLASPCVSGCSAFFSAVVRGGDLSIVKAIAESGGVVTDDILEAAKDKPEILAFLKAKKEQQP